MGLTEGSEVHACVPGVCSWFLQLLSGTTSIHVTVSRMSLIRANLLPYHSQKMEESAPRRGRVTFGWLVGLSQVLGLVSVVLTGVWMGHYKGGFAWDGSAQQFNVHPLCMVLGLVFLQGDGKSTKKTNSHSSMIVSHLPFSLMRLVLRVWCDGRKTPKNHHGVSSSFNQTVCLLACTWHVKQLSYISIICTTKADRNAVTAIPGCLQRCRIQSQNA